MKIVGNINKSVEIMNEVSPIPSLPKLNGCTSAMASRYFGITIPACTDFIKRHKKNLTRLGLHKIEPSTLFEVGYIYLRPGKWDFDNEPYYLYAGYEREKRVSYILPPECLLYMAHRLKNSEIALKICEATDGIIHFDTDSEGVSSSNIEHKCSVSPGSGEPSAANDSSAAGFCICSEIFTHNGLEYFERDGVVLFSAKGVLKLLWPQAKPQGIEQVMDFLKKNCYTEEAGDYVFIDMAGVTMLTMRASDKDAAKLLIDDIAMNIMPEMNARIAQKNKEAATAYVTTATDTPPMVIQMGAPKEEVPATTVTASGENGLMVYENQSFGTVRALEIDGEPWFVAVDACRALDLANPTRSLSRLDDDEKGLHIVKTLGGDQNVNIISETGLIALILTSRKPEAKAFKRWITHEVIPAIRKHGMYMTDAALAKADDIDQLDAMVQRYKSDIRELREAKEWIACLEEDNSRLENENKKLSEKNAVMRADRNRMALKAYRGDLCSIINIGVRTYSHYGEFGMFGKAWSVFYDKISTVLNEDVRARLPEDGKKVPYITLIKDQELPIVLSVLNDMCVQQGYELISLVSPERMKLVTWCMTLAA